MRKIFLVSYRCLGIDWPLVLAQPVKRTFDSNEVWDLQEELVAFSLPMLESIEKVIFFH